MVGGVFRALLLLGLGVGLREEMFVRGCWGRVEDVRVGQESGENGGVFLVLGFGVRRLIQC